MTFALGELLLGLFTNARSHFGLDLESFWILTCIADATMRPVILNLAQQPEILAVEHLPDDLRGRVSRRFVADETGLPRETVRRKVRELVAAGYVGAGEDDELLFARTRLSDPKLQQAILDGHRLVQRYWERLEELGFDPKRLDNKPAS